MGKEDFKENHEISRMYHWVRDTRLIKEYFSEKERLGKLCRSVQYAQMGVQA